MKTTLIALLLLPFVSFGQLSEEAKNSIDDYAISVCGCVDELIDELHPEVAGVILLMDEKGQEEAMLEVQEMLTEMTSEEMEDFLMAFKSMDSDAFEQKVEDCDSSHDLSDRVEDQINNELGEAYDYFMETLEREEICQVMKALYNLGNSMEE